MTGGLAMPAASTLPMKRSTVTIVGPNFDAVYLAWQDMLGYLPLLLVFELREGQALDAALITQLMEKLKVSIIIKPKLKQNLKSIMVRGTEKDSMVLFDVRRQIMDLDRSEVPYCCQPHQLNKLQSAPTIASLSASQVPLAQPRKIPSLTESLASLLVENMPLPQTMTSSFFDQPISAFSASCSDYDGMSSNTSSNTPLGYQGTTKPNQGQWTELVRRGHVYSEGDSQESSPSSDQTTPTSNVSGPSSLDVGSIWWNQKENARRISKQEPNPEKVYKPTNLFSGYGFSQTLDLKRYSEWPSVSTNGFGSGSNPIWTPTSTDPLSGSSSYRGRSLSRNFNSSDGFAQASYNMPHVSDKISPSNSSAFDKVDLVKLLCEMGLMQFSECFENVTLPQFLSMTEDDLIRVGVNTTPARYRCLTLITQMRSLWRFKPSSAATCTSTFKAAPGAERLAKRD